MTSVSDLGYSSMQDLSVGDAKNQEQRSRHPNRKRRKEERGPAMGNGHKQPDSTCNAPKHQ